MSSICGFFHRHGQPIQPTVIETMTHTLNHWTGDSVGTWHNDTGTVALGHVKLINTPQSLDETLPFFHTPSRLSITADARIDNREDLFDQLAIPHSLHSTIPDSQLILKAYQKWSRDCVGHLLGDFAFAIWDEGKKQLFCARDHLGNKPFFYFMSSDVFIFTTEMKGIFKVRDLPRTLNQNWIADALTVSVADKEYTSHPDIWRLPPAHWFAVSAMALKRGNYWSLDPRKEIHLASEYDYIETFREKLSEAVRCRVRSAFPVGSELSGGLDSSAVTALAAQHTKTQNLKLITFSNVLCKEDQTPHGLTEDESQFQNRLRHHAGINHACCLTSQNRGIIESLKHTLTLQDGPPLRSFGSFSDVLYEAGSKEGIRTLLSGFGGDWGVSVQAWGYLKELAQKREWKNLWQEYRQLSPERQKFPIKPLLIQMAGEYFPFLKTSYSNFRDKLWHARKNSHLVQMKTFSLTPEFYQDADIQNRLATISQIPPGGSVRDWQYHRLMSPQIPIRLEYCSIAAASHRMEYRHPLLDIRLLEFHLAVPACFKRKNGYGRYLFRMAIEGTVPPEIQWRDNKFGSTTPAAPQRFNRDFQAIKKLIVRSKQNQGAYYLDLEHMLKRGSRILNMEKKQIQIRQGAYINALMLLLYLEGN